VTSGSEWNHDIDCGWRRKQLPDGSIAEVVPLTFGRARINLYEGWTVKNCW